MVGPSLALVAGQSTAGGAGGDGRGGGGGGHRGSGGSPEGPMNSGGSMENIEESPTTCAEKGDG